MAEIDEQFEGAMDQWYESIVQNNTIDGKVVSLPFFTDAGVFYYRTDLLEKHGREVPTTWTELQETLQRHAAADFFKLPSNAVVELGSRVHI